MAVIWIICGSGRGVGKTHLAKELSKVIPKSVCVKHGHGKAKTDKADNYFRTEDEVLAFIESCRESYDNILVESNSLARQGNGNIIIFIDGIPRGSVGVRGDAKKLRSVADVHIDYKSTFKEWRKSLRHKVPDHKLLDTVCEIFLEQKHFICKLTPMVRTKVWLTLGNEHVFGSGLSHLLECLGSHETLRAAAKANNMSYRYAWDLIKNAERHFGVSLTSTQAGGEGGGGTKLTEQGRRMLLIYNRLNEEVAAFADKSFTSLVSEVRADE